MSSEDPVEECCLGSALDIEFVLVHQSVHYLICIGEGFFGPVHIVVTLVSVAPFRMLMKCIRDLVISGVWRGKVVPVVNLRILDSLHEDHPLHLHHEELDQVNVLNAQRTSQVTCHPGVINPKELCSLRYLSQPAGSARVDYVDPASTIRRETVLWCISL